MPIYEYRCEKCGEVTEQLVLGTQETPVCAHCGSADLVKLMSAANVGAGSPAASPPPAGSCCGTPGSCGSPGKARAIMNFQRRPIAMSDSEKGRVTLKIAPPRGLSRASIVPW